MDLAEIRKKAKSKDKGGSGPRKGGRPVVNAAPPAPPAIEEKTVPDRPVLPAEPPPLPAPVSAATAIDALFNSPFEIETATEENYLQALRQSGEEEADNLRQILFFSLGSEDYCLDIECIREIIKLREITDIPRVPDFVLGIISLRGIIIPVYDLKNRLRLGKTEISPSSRIIVCQHEDRVVGLLVDSITQVVRLPNQKIEPPPAVLSGLDREMVEGVGRHQGRMMILLHLPCVIDAELI